MTLELYYLEETDSICSNRVVFALCRRPQFDRAVLEWRKQAQWEKLKKVKSSYADQTHG